MGGRQGGRSVKKLITWHPQIGRREYAGHWTRHETSRSSFPFLKVLQHLQRVPAAEDQLLKHMSLCRRGSPSNHKDNRISWVLRLFRITRTKSGVCGLNHTIYFHHSLSSASTPPPRSSLPPTHSAPSEPEFQGEVVLALWHAGTLLRLWKGLNTGDMFLSDSQVLCGYSVTLVPSPLLQGNLFCVQLWWIKCYRRIDC